MLILWRSQSQWTQAASCHIPTLDLWFMIIQGTDLALFPEEELVLAGSRCHPELCAAGVGRGQRRRSRAVRKPHKQIGASLVDAEALRRSFPMVSFHIRQFQERDYEQVVDLFSRGLEEHIPNAFRHLLKLPRTLLLLLGVPIAIVLVSGSWLLAVVCNFFLLVFLRFLASCPWKNYVSKCLHTDMADITKSYLSSCGSGFWVAESGGQVVGLVGGLPVKDPPLGRRQLQLFRLSVSSQHRGQGIAKALVRTVLQFARDQGYSDVVLETGFLQRGAVTLYYSMGFQKTGESFMDMITWLVDLSVIHFIYPLPSAQEHEP